MHSDFHIVDLLLAVQDGLIKKNGQPFSYRPLREYLESLGWREIFSGADRLIGIVTEGIDSETLHEGILSFLVPADRFEFLDAPGLDLPASGTESQWFAHHFPEHLP